MIFNTQNNETNTDKESVQAMIKFNLILTHKSMIKILLCDSISPN